MEFPSILNSVIAGPMVSIDGSRFASFRCETQKARITRWYGLITDIDDRKRAEDELKRSEADTGLWLKRPATRWSVSTKTAHHSCEPRNKRIFGYAPEELIGKPLTVLMPKAMRGLHETGFKRYLETGERQLNWQGTEVTAMRAER
jgi:PAS domain-containing protein